MTLVGYGIALVPAIPTGTVLLADLGGGVNARIGTPCDALGSGTGVQAACGDQ